MDGFAWHRVVENDLPNNQVSFPLWELQPNLTEERLRKAPKRMKRERIHQMLQIIWMHIDCRQHLCTEDASEALCLIWCSVPDAYISFKEIKRAFRGIFRAEELKNIYDFYAKAVGCHRFNTCADR
ncbi:hypothetical protein AVEN_57652-1 [Araneus ventricosus]|uniref:Uncharacterized protein n=1 Tax=Araneus ventricosus TaxID=182803 RepID=A0A4Y2NGQ0_ARAVE|nr:hypothetical protein AVEN_57652-1 [Araneus ventricosus]